MRHPPGLRFQLILHRRHQTPTSVGCELKLHSQDQVVANVLDPVFLDPTNPGITNPGITNTDISNATIDVAPGEEVQATLRIIDADRSDNETITYTNPFTGVVTQVSIDPDFDPRTDFSTVTVSQAVNTADAAAGVTDPPLIVNTGGEVTDTIITLAFATQPSDAFPNTAISPPVQALPLSSAPAPAARSPWPLKPSTQLER